MKKPHLLKHLFLIVSIMLFLHSCKKDNKPEAPKDQTSTQSLVNIAKSSLEKQSVAGSPMISSLKSIGLTPDWSDVKTRINSKNKTVLAIPLEKTISSFSELNVIITNGIPNEVIKKYTVAQDNSILLEFYSLNGRLLKAGRYNPATRKFFESKALPNKVSLYENVKSGFRSNANVLLLLSNNTVRTSIKDRAIAGINEPKKPTDTPDLGIPLDEVDIVTEGPKKPDVPDPLGPPSPDPNTVDSWPIEPINEVGGSDGNVIAPPIIITIDIRMKYPTLAKIIDGLYQKAISNPKLMAALKQFSHLSEQQILDNLKSGKGPLIQVVDPNSLIGGSVGEFDPISGIIRISETVASDANYFSTVTPTAAELYLTVCILHEFIHYGENTTQIFVSHEGHGDDAGFQFENQFYGGKVGFNSVTGVLTYNPL